MGRVLVGTTRGLLAFDETGRANATALEGHDIAAVAPESWDRLWAIAEGREIWRTGAQGEWGRVASLANCPAATRLRATCLADTRANPAGGILVGTSEAHLVRVDERHEVHLVESFDDAPGRAGWFTPWGGPPDTRSITENGDTVFVNVHVGGVLRSRDEGATWEPTLDIGADIHRVVTGNGRVYAAGAYGLSTSDDGGTSWRLSDSGLHASYCRAVTVCGPGVLLSASDGPHGGRAALYRSDAATGEFERCQGGLPEWFEGNIDSLCLDSLPDGSVAAFGTETGEVYASMDRGESWSRLAAGLDGVR